MIVTLLVCAIIALVVFIYSTNKRPKNFPPGPIGLPILGNIHQLDANVHKGFAKLRNKYGDILSIKLGSLSAIVLHDPKHIKEAFGRDAFSWRPIFPHFRDQETGLQRGIVFSNDHEWDEQRKFAIRTLRDFGLKYGSRSMESLLLEEVHLLIGEFAATAGKPIWTHPKFGVAVINALWILVAGKRFEHDDPNFKFILEEFYKMATNPKTQGALVFFPWFAKYFPRLSGLTKHVELMTPIYNMIKDGIGEHKQNNPNGGNFDLIDSYIQEMKKPDQDKLSFMGSAGDANLMMTVHDLFIAGVETASTTLTWICLLMAHHPESQKKVSDEISFEIGTSRLPRLNDRARMPYCEAMILETLRYATIFPLSIFHCAKEDNDFQGYTIPKDTLIISNLWYVDHNPEFWNEPEKFKPERFLSKDGKSIVRSEVFMPFSTGKRACLGEGLARDEIFLFSTAIFQRFEVGFVPGEAVPELKNFPGATINTPLPHVLQMKDKIK